MLADQNLLIQVILQTCLVILIGYGAFFSIRILHLWQPERTDERQLALERRGYLISRIVQYALVFQTVGLFVQIYTLNSYLPGVIRGAMCARGVLDLNPLGYYWLGFRLAVVLLSVFYLYVNRFDHREPEYPMTPFKYYFLPVIAIFGVCDWGLMIEFFSGIEPDVIATCCSFSLGTVSSVGTEQMIPESMVHLSLAVFYLSGGWQIYLSWTRKRNRGFVISMPFFLVTAVYSLQYHFVKYIYALPSHTCLFDLFLADYYYVGYVLFGLLITILVSFIIILVSPGLTKRLHNPSVGTDRVWFSLLRWSVLVYLVLTTFYWLRWKFVVL